MERGLSWLKEARKVRNLTTYVVAQRAGISQAYYSQIENGVRNASVSAAKKIATVLLFDWTMFYRDTAAQKRAPEGGAEVNS